MRRWGQEKGLLLSRESSKCRGPGAATWVSITPREAPLPCGGRLRAGGLGLWLQEGASAGPLGLPPELRLCWTFCPPLLSPPRPPETLGHSFSSPSPLSGETGKLRGPSCGRAGGLWLRSVTGQLAGRETGSLLSAASFPRAGVPAESVIYSGHNSAVGLVRVGNMLVSPSQV